MSRQFVRLKDGAVVLANVRRGRTLTANDWRTLEEWAAECRERAAKQQRERNQKMLRGDH